MGQVWTKSIMMDGQRCTLFSSSTMFTGASKSDTYWANVKDIKQTPKRQWNLYLTSVKTLNDQSSSKPQREQRHDLEETHRRFTSQKPKQPVVTKKQTIFKNIFHSHNVRGNRTISHQIQQHFLLKSWRIFLYLKQSKQEEGNVWATPWNERNGIKIHTRFDSTLLTSLIRVSIPLHPFSYNKPWRH